LEDINVSIAKLTSGLNRKAALPTPEQEYFEREVSQKEKTQRNAVNVLRKSNIKTKANTLFARFVAISGISF
jgi:hypothetical protein